MQMLGWTQQREDGNLAALLLNLLANLYRRLPQFR
jgi:hypothetical protein